MIKYRNSPNNNIVEISVEGQITEADFDQAIAQMKADIKKHGKLRILEQLSAFSFQAKPSASESWN